MIMVMVRSSKGSYVLAPEPRSKKNRELKSLVPFNEEDSFASSGDADIQSR